ncbi:MAG: hypothetical protein ACYTGV_13120 [Planctomycetota bacterium]|jgi:hypothetical protein
MKARIATATCVVLILGACASTREAVLQPDAIPLGEGVLRLELVRYAGRMTALAWVDDESNLVLKLRLDRPTFELPVEFRKADDYYQELLDRTGSEEKANVLFAEHRSSIDEAYESDVTSSFEAFWKTGPFGTPAEFDRTIVLNEHLVGPGVHRVQVALEPDTVSWSASFRLLRVLRDGRSEPLLVFDLDSGMRGAPARDRVLAPPIRVRVPRHDPR